MPELPWYRDGLQFTCTQCGDCCSGAPGFVWVTTAEIQALAGFVTGGDVEAFEDQYVRRIGARRSLKEFPNGDCVFLDEKTRRCTVYADRPAQCRTWPFWDSNLQTPEDWERTCRDCPGSGKGRLYQVEKIEEQRKVVKV
jgi:hypothetical protein